MIIVTFLSRWTSLGASSLLLLAGCARADEDATNGPATPSGQSNVKTPKFVNRSGSNDDNYEARNAAFEEFAAKQRENNLRGISPPPSQFHFPNVYGEPFHPRPCYVNFYSVNDHYPDYLLCEYDVEVTHYNQSDESGWFGEALAQIRRYGPKKFPPVKWVAVIIKNRAEHKDESTFEQSFKVGAIFKADDVFDAVHNVSELITQVSMDRHPFFFDRTKPDLFPSEQQRWIIVEQHAATNSPVSKKN
jgi:hypothetical protein